MRLLPAVALTSLLLAGCAHHNTEPLIRAESAPHRESGPAPVANGKLKPGQELCLSVNGITWGTRIDEARLAGMGLHRRSLQTGETAYTDGRGGLTVISSHNVVVGIEGTQLSNGATILGKQGDNPNAVVAKISKQLERTDSSHDSSTQKGVFTGHGACKHGNYFLMLNSRAQKLQRIVILTDPSQSEPSETPSPTP
jgi:hypothetical protein